MAKAKSTKAAEEVKEVKAEEAVTMTKDDFKKMFEEAKKEALAELKEELEAEKDALSKKDNRTAAEKKGYSEGYVAETPEQIAWAEELVEVTAPLDYNESDEINLTINGYTIQILRGETVKIPRKYALVLKNMIDQQKASRKYQEEVRSQVTYVD